MVGLSAGSAALRPDVAVLRAGGQIYLTDGRRTLRLPDCHEATVALDSAPEVAEHGREVLAIRTALREKGFLADRSSSAAPGAPINSEQPHIAAELAGVADQLNRRVLLPQTEDDFLGRIKVTADRVGQSPSYELLTISLWAEPDIFRQANLEALSQGLPMLVHLVGHRAVFGAVLRPPKTPCLACLTNRLRANVRWPDIRDANIGNLLVGRMPDEQWPDWSTARTWLAGLVNEFLTGENMLPAVLVEWSRHGESTIHHPILRAPYCRGCHDLTRPKNRGGVSYDRLRNTARTPLAVSAERLERVCDPLTGIVGRVEIRSDEDVIIHASTVGGSDTSLFSEVRAPASGGASKPSERQARVAALGEAVERYACGIYRNSDLIEATYQQLGENAIDPRSYPLGSDRDYERAAGHVVEFDPAARIRWTEVQSLTSPGSYLLPAAFIYLPYRGCSEKERLWRPISTGLAAGATLTEAIVAGLYEIIERDSLVITWLNRLRVPTVDLAGLTGEAGRILDRLTARGVDVVCKWTTTDLGVPSVLIRALDPSGDPLVAFSTRAHLDPEACIAGALAELEQSRNAVREMLRKNPICPTDRAPVSMEDHFTYYAASDRLGRLEFLREGPRMRLPEASPIPTAGEELDRLVKHVHSAGFEILYKDLTTADLSDVDIRVVRVVVPGLQPLTFGQDFMHLGGRRLYQAPVAMGCHDRPLREEELNPDPIPGG